MSGRRLSSRRVALTATFLALAAGGSAACDASADDEWGSTDPPPFAYDPAVPDDPAVVVDPEPEAEPEPEPDSDDDGESVAEVFYCADEQGEIVDEGYCADDGGNLSYFIWHSAGYPRGLKPGAVLDGGDYFPAGDRALRREFKLPGTGRVANGTVKTNIVGSGSNGSMIGGGASSGG